MAYPNRFVKGEKGIEGGMRGGEVMVMVE